MKKDLLLGRRARKEVSIGSIRVKTDLSLEARRIIKASTQQDALLKTRQFHWNWTLFQCRRYGILLEDSTGFGWLHVATDKVPQDHATSRQ